MACRPDDGIERGFRAASWITGLLFEEDGGCGDAKSLPDQSELPGFHQEGDRNGKRGWSIALGLV
jgi:hypothetical protein